MSDETGISRDLAGLGDIQDLEHVWTLETCVRAIRDLPDLYMRHGAGVNPEWNDSTPPGQFFEYLRRSYRAVGLWLKYYLLNRTEHLAELTFTDKIHNKPLAERAVAFFRLAQEVWLRSDLQTQIPCPGFWMVACERDLLKIGLQASGYTGSPRVRGKTERYRAFVENSERWLEPSNFKFTCSTELTALQALENEGIRLAASDGQFGEDYWLPFVKTVRRTERQVKQGKLSGIYLNQLGELKVIRRGKQSKISKGFGNEL